MNVQVATRLLELAYRGRRPKAEAPYSIVRSYLLYAMVAPPLAALTSAVSPRGTRTWAGCPKPAVSWTASSNGLRPGPQTRERRQDSVSLPAWR